MTDNRRSGEWLHMEYLPWSNHVQQGDIDAPPITAEGRHVVIIVGGDTGADCLGTVHRQGAASVTQLEIMPTPPEHRTARWSDRSTASPGSANASGPPAARHGAA